MSLYSKGDRVRLVFTDDPLTRLRPGDKGTVWRDQSGEVVDIRWDDGSSLSMLLDSGDQIERITS